MQRTESSIYRQRKRERESDEALRKGHTFTYIMQIYLYILCKKGMVTASKKQKEGRVGKY